MSLNSSKSPAPRANAGNRENQDQREPLVSTTTEASTPTFATFYVSRRYGLPLPIASVVAGLANLGRALG